MSVTHSYTYIYSCGGDHESVLYLKPMMMSDHDVLNIYRVAPVLYVS